MALSTFRIDGHWEAAIKFLTIEDGEGYPKHQLETPESFRKVLEVGSQFIQTKNNPLIARKGLIVGGRPGVFIAKIMAHLIADSNCDWDYYRHNVLYGNAKNEANIKFYPLALQGADNWTEQLTQYLGIDLATYRDYSWLFRPNVIARRLEKFKQHTKVYVIMGAFYEWLSVLSRAMNKANLDGVFFNSVSFNNGKSSFRFWRFQDQDGVDVHWAHFPVFTRGLCDNDVPLFCDELRKMLPSVADGLSARWSQA